MDWGRLGHVEALLADAFDVTTSGHDATWRSTSAQMMVDEFTTSFGPLKT